MECVCNLGKLKSFELVSHNVIKTEMLSVDVARLGDLVNGKGDKPENIIGLAKLAKHQRLGLCISIGGRLVSTLC